MDIAIDQIEQEKFNERMRRYEESKASSRPKGDISEPVKGDK